MKLFVTFFAAIFANEYAATEAPAAELTPDDIKADQEQIRICKDSKHYSERSVMENWMFPY